MLDLYPDAVPVTPVTYCTSITTNGALDTNKVLVKMAGIFNQHCNNHTSPMLAASCAFEFGRDLIGFDMAEAWRMGVMCCVVSDKHPTRAA
jgi:hypothetical protein